MYEVGTTVYELGAPVYEGVLLPQALSPIATASNPELAAKRARRITPERSDCFKLYSKPDQERLFYDD